MYRNTDIIAPNESETEILTGVAVDTLDNAAKAGRILLSRGVGTAIIELGQRGCLYVAEDQTRFFSAVKVEAVDVTGAGDAFAGGLLVALAEGRTRVEAIKFATCVAATLSYQGRRGERFAQPARGERLVGPSRATVRERTGATAMSGMSARQRVLAVYRNEVPDRTPVGIYSPLSSPR